MFVACMSEIEPYDRIAGSVHHQVSLIAVLCQWYLYAWAWNFPRHLEHGEDGITLRSITWTHVPVRGKHRKSSTGIPCTTGVALLEGSGCHNNEQSYNCPQYLLTDFL